MLNRKLNGNNSMNVVSPRKMLKRKLNGTNSMNVVSPRKMQAYGNARHLANSTFKITKQLHDINPIFKFKRIFMKNDNKHIFIHNNRIGQKRLTLKKNLRLNNDNVYFFEIGLYYSSLKHDIGAIKYKNVLYIFDPAGIARNPFITRVANKLANLFGKNVNVVYYNGPNLQDFYGGRNQICVALTRKFLITMAIIFNSRINRGLSLNRNSISYHINRIFKNVTVSNVPGIYNRLLNRRRVRNIPLI